MAAGDAVGADGGASGGPDGSDVPPGAEFYLDLARRLREAHRRAEALPEGVRIPVIRRLLTVTEAVKRDPVRGSERLDRMLEEISTQVEDPPTR